MIDEIKNQLTERIREEQERKKRNSLLRTLIITAIVSLILLQVVFGAAVVEGHSMEPGVKDGSIVIFYRLDETYSAGDIVIADTPSGEVVKRIASNKNGKIWLSGDNPEKSIDSRVFGTITEESVIGRVVYVLAMP